MRARTLTPHRSASGPQWAEQASPPASVDLRAEPFAASPFLVEEAEEKRAEAGEPGAAAEVESLPPWESESYASGQMGEAGRIP